MDEALRKRVENALARLDALAKSDDGDRNKLAHETSFGSLISTFRCLLDAVDSVPPPAPAPSPIYPCRNPESPALDREAAHELISAATNYRPPEWVVALLAVRNMTGELAQQRTEDWVRSFQPIRAALAKLPPPREEPF